MKAILFTVPLVLLIAACDQGTEIVAPEGPEATFALSPTDMDAPALVSEFGNPVPAEVVVSHNGLDWVWASPCPLGAPTFPSGTCGILLGHEGFDFATVDQWAQRPPIDAFGTGPWDVKCASPWFSLTQDGCDWVDALPETDDSWHNSIGWSTYGSAPFLVGGAAGGYGDPMAFFADTWLVRESVDDPVADPQSKSDCKGGGWGQFNFRNQGQCIRFVQTGKDSR